MIFNTSSFITAGQIGMNGCISGIKKITGNEAGAIREILSTLRNEGYEKVYMDASDVEEADLSGINEIINAHYRFQKSNLPFVLIYRRNSVMEKWVSVTGMDAYLQTAIVPSAS